jgi:hypothetical protein
MSLPGVKEDIRPGKVGTLNARKKQPKPAGTSKWSVTMLKTSGGKAGSLEDYKNKRDSHDVPLRSPGKPGLGKGKVAKPAGSSSFKATMI